ncbi:tripartite motif-containing protein 16-like [Parambassis ranga]|uniref:Tripartite motif-containing protein 16-like n=1 Tax=Parambassis ranga TaxID=210632 RepID=A0A6P7JMJ2_9TELE|nr:tripartite motif-containing protein 16-like [Parambassis ranga]
MHSLRGEMAQQGIQLDQEKLSCSICLDLLKDPVTIPCGHSYCMSCIKSYWDEEKESYSCPQCRQSFTPRPALVKNTMFAELVEELTKAGLQSAAPDHFYAGPGDVACDFCTGRKLKASKSCLVCMASYCEQHLQPHYNVAPLKKHKLIEATSKLQENICPRHDEVMKIFCHTDQQSICYLCTLDEHKGHVTVSVAAERAEKQTELQGNRQKIQKRIKDGEKDVEVLLQRVEAVNLTADRAVEDSEKTFKVLICIIEKKSAEVQQKIRFQQEAEVSQCEELLEAKHQEISELRIKDTELEQLSLKEDHLHFLNSYHSLTHLSESKDSPSTSVQPKKCFEDVMVAVAKIRDEVCTALSEKETKSPEKSPETSSEKTPVRINEVGFQEPKTRAGFLKFACQITLDPVTANQFLFLSKNNRKVTLKSEAQLKPWIHPETFLNWWQVLSSNGLTGCCYWEAKWSGNVIIAVAYKDISRTGSRRECGFGNNVKSWALDCDSDGYTFRHKNKSLSVSGPLSSRVGVFLDHRAGSLSFYSVTKTMNLLHRVQTRFTQPLYAGFWLPGTAGDSVEVCEL